MAVVREVCQIGPCFTILKLNAKMAMSRRRGHASEQAFGDRQRYLRAHAAEFDG
jgi:hypothetical protein